MFFMATIGKTELFRARIDRGRKERTEKILRRFGLTPGQAVNVFFAKIEEVDGLPFDLRPEPDETRELMSNPAFLQHLKRMQAGDVRYTTAENLPM
jgi:addiction module RelB/DinJ family antitoxin